MTTEVTTDLEMVHRRLEREKEAVSRLINKIKSYRFEPKDYNCFQLQQQLRFELSELLSAQGIALEKFNSIVASKDSFLPEIERLSKQFKKLEKKMAEYLLQVTS